MAERRITRVDFCKSLNLKPQADLHAPLDAVVPVGIAAVGCRPAIVHHRAANGAIVSRVDQKALTYVRSLLAEEAEDVSNPEVSPAIAGLPRAVMSGVATLPYPADPLGYEVLFSINGLPQFRDIAELPPTNVGNLVNADGLGVSEVGGGVYRDLLLGGPARFNGGSIFQPYRSYEYGGIYVVCPGGEPTILRYNPNVPEYVWPGLGTYRIGSTYTQKVDPMQPDLLPEYNVRVAIWEATPAFAAFMSGETLEPSVVSATHSELNGPSLARKYVFHPYATATMPAYGGAYTAQHALGGARVNLILWATSDMDAVAINGDLGSILSPGSAPTSRVPIILQGPTNTEYQIHTFPKAFAYSIDPFETTFTAAFTAFGGAVSTGPSSPFAFSADNTIPRWYEGIAVAFIQTT